MANNLTDDLIGLIFNIGQSLREKVHAKHSSDDCSFMHMHTLHFVKDRDGATMRDVANLLHITPPSATSLVNALVKKGFIKRATDANDRRTVKLQITKDGINLLKKSFKKKSAIIEQNINKLSEVEKKSFINILNKLSK
ncbi:MAG: MarR family transcriptional regulator [Candidatus Falkowbacteria bacterium]